MNFSLWVSSQSLTATTVVTSSETHVQLMEENSKWAGKKLAQEGGFITNLFPPIWIFPFFMLPACGSANLKSIDLLCGHFSSQIVLPHPLITRPPC